MNRRTSYLPLENEGLLQSDPLAYTALVNNIQRYGIFLLDIEANIRSWNVGAEKITGKSRAQVLGKPYQSLYSALAIAEGLPHKTLTSVRQYGHISGDSRRSHFNHNELLVEHSLDAIRNAESELTGFVEVFRDVTLLRKEQSALYDKATRDSLTGIANRGFFVEAAKREIERSQTFYDPLSLVMMDIDFFKKVNDTYGHEGGDVVLKHFVSVIKSKVREVDVFARIGGEEFVVLLPRSNGTIAEEAAMRMRLAVAESPIDYQGKTIRFTSSFGVAQLTPSMREVDDLVRAADVALYRAKRAGRNCVAVWQG